MVQTGHWSPITGHYVAAALALALLCATAGAQPFPTRPVRFLVPNPPGGGTDLVARIAAQKVSGKWGVNLVVDNRPGAGGITAVEVAAKSAPDGHTLLIDGRCQHEPRPLQGRGPGAGGPHQRPGRTRARGCTRAATTSRPTPRRNGSAASSRARSPNGARSFARPAFALNERA